ncbi:hypothetical protein VIBNISOn1_1540022 [Vibrio nigripulchritudo SOn1]|uniref:Uncharacterized protein n=1 Tax=Vibrio nigripulchritudo SOn1 TaxID=1238450 RepID=A0AAV2VLQ3_9VIBR|nr:hypothetical protein VIBNISOn1_1540022 [Vibrio nigripulchritudo SOn1]
MMMVSNLEDTLSTFFQLFRKLSSIAAIAIAFAYIYGKIPEEQEILALNAFIVLAVIAYKRKRVVSS